MLKLTEWNSVMHYAQKKCSEITDCDMRIRPYTMYDGRKGIYVQIFDDFGKFYRQFPSGIWDSAEEYMKAIDHAIEYLLRRI